MLPATSSVPDVESFFHADTGSWTHVVYQGQGSPAVIIDPVLDFDLTTATTATVSADAVLAFVRSRQLDIRWILETHAHADHLSASGYLHDVLGAPVAIGAGILGVQAHFGHLFGLDREWNAGGSPFDRLLHEGDRLAVGALDCRVVATPGHTEDGLTYLIGDAAFIGDTLFAPDVGTSRTDFPGGDARRLYASIRTILELPERTRLFLCHDYPTGARAPLAETSVAEQVAHNIHVGGAVDSDAFVAKRRARDASLSTPRLILPALQVNIRGGRLPAADADGSSYLRLPLNRLAKGS